MESRQLRELSPLGVLDLSAFALEAPDLGFSLRTPEIVKGTLGLFGRAELRAEISSDLGHAQHRLGGDVAVIRQ